MVSLRICGVRQSIAYPIVTIVRWIRLPCRSPIHHGIIEFTAVPFIEYALLDFRAVSARLIGLAEMIHGLS